MTSAFIPSHAAACVYCAHGPWCRTCTVELPSTSPTRWPVCEPHMNAHREILAGTEPLPVLPPRAEQPQEPKPGARRVDCYGRLWVRTYVPYRDTVRVLWACWDKDLPDSQNPVYCSWSNLLRWLAKDYEKNREG